MKNAICSMLLLASIGTGMVLAGEKMVITFKDGSVQSFNTDGISRIEFTSGNAAAANPTVTRPAPVAVPAAKSWTGQFSGNDSSGYAMEIRLVESGGNVTGGYSYFHKGQNKQVTAIIENATIDGDSLRGNWKQVKGIVAEGTFVWQWLPGQKGQAFEGSFNGTKYWGKMTREN